MLGDAFELDEELLESSDEDDEALTGSDEPDSGSAGDEEDESESEDEENESPSADEVRAEREIEGDFDRLVQNIRVGNTSSSSSSGGLEKNWDFNIEESEAQFRDDLREASGRGRVAGPILSQQVKALIGEGNQAYVDNDLSEAIRIMQEVIRIEPRAVSAWSVLAQCYEDEGQEMKGLQLRIMAAHLRHDADEWGRLARQSREHGYNQQALYCYRKVYSLDPTNVDALWDRASLAKEIGDLRTARNAFLAILKRYPHDLTVLRELHTILVELSDLPTCASLLQQAFEYYQKTYPLGHGLDPTTGAPVPGGGFSRLDLLLLADLYNALGEHESAIEVIRKGTRWLQGRAEQKYWDLCEDDREYDGEGWPARIVTAESGGVQAGRFELDANARHRLAVARIKMGEVEEGKLHANAVLSEDVLDYAVLFAEIADAYFDREMYAEAKPIYELLGGDPATSSLYVLLQTAACLRMLDELKEAAEVYEHIKLADPSNNDAKMKLAEIYEIMNEPRKALELVYEVIDSRKKRPRDRDAAQGDDAANAGTSLFAEERTTAKSKATALRAQNRLSHAQLRELEAEREKEVVRGYKRVKDLWGKMLAGEEAGEREWLVEAEKLVETFRETRNLFLTSRSHPFRGMFPRSRKAKQQAEENEAEEDRMMSRLHLDIEREGMARKAAKHDDKGVDVFRGVSFDDWLRLFMQYAFLLTKRGEYDLADEVLRHIMVSNAYQLPERQDSIRIALMTCALTTQRHTIVVEQARKLITLHQFNNEPQRILMAALASGLRPTDAFITSTLQKHLFREMKLADTAVKNPEMLKWNPLNKRYALNSLSRTADQDDDDDRNAEEEEVGAPVSSNHLELPTKQNPVIVTIYGQICIAAKSYQSAIFYLLHAYDYCQDDPMICLCLAIASIGRAMQRQSDNRHHLITQAMAFLTRYRTLRGTDAKGVGEVEFNFGRTFHQLGLYSHAVKHYERVLEMAERGIDDTFARESAYNLSLIYVITGAIPLANDLYRRWLSI
ncbi:hypothetical protein BDQ12DRAFT_736397 [Crucibulum laeve]|uniref:TPR-like protein n=1 Tax=Crucibulum laeve TaxID=68775 RepID=A0A5C3LVW0_9AGAR|nr:hypothetical protein BDQ12DRAFT_736397 [Crucibulum laeve]